MVVRFRPFDHITFKNVYTGQYHLTINIFNEDVQANFELLQEIFMKIMDSMESRTKLCK
jgi:deferrochelatase/peroxidase EfeB